MKSKVTAYSRKDGLLSLTVENKELAQKAKKGDEVTIHGTKSDGTYVLWNTVPPNVIQFSHGNNAQLSGSADIPETQVTTEASVEWEQEHEEKSRSHSAR